jgi:mannosyltransferase OCH1-like enzyme
MVHTYKDLGRISSMDVKSVPKIMWRTGPYRVNTIPSRVMAFIRKAMQTNPEHLMFYFDDRDCRSFVADYYPEYLQDYDDLVPTAYKADIWRYMVLDKFGGCYADLTQSLNVPYSDLCQGVDGVFCRDYGMHLHAGDLYNAVMCSRPGDKIVQRALTQSIRNIRNRYYGGNPLAITGPIVLGRAYKDLFEKTQRSVPIRVGRNEKYMIIDHNPHQQISIDGTIVGRVKAEWHHSSLYDEIKQKHYSQLWHDRQVYRD